MSKEIENNAPAVKAEEQPVPAIESRADTPPTTPVDDTESEEVASVPEEQTEVSKPAREAARYRRQLRDTEELLEQSNARAEQLQQQVLHGLLSQPVEVAEHSYVALKHADDFARFSQTEPDKFAASDGSVSADLVTTELQKLHAERPDLFENRTHLKTMVPIDLGTVRGPVPHELETALNTLGRTNTSQAAQAFKSEPV